MVSLLKSKKISIFNEKMENQALETVLRHHRKFATRLVFRPCWKRTKKNKKRSGEFHPQVKNYLPILLPTKGGAIARYLLKTIYKTPDLRIISKTK